MKVVVRMLFAYVFSEETVTYGVCRPRALSWRPWTRNGALCRSRLRAISYFAFKMSTNPCISYLHNFIFLYDKFSCTFSFKNFLNIIRKSFSSFWKFITTSMNSFSDYFLTYIQMIFGQVYCDFVASLFWKVLFIIL